MFSFYAPPNASQSTLCMGWTYDDNRSTSASAYVFDAIAKKTRIRDVRLNDVPTSENDFMLFFPGSRDSPFMFVVFLSDGDYFIRSFCPTV